MDYLLRYIDRADRAYPNNCQPAMRLFSPLLQF